MNVIGPSARDRGYILSTRGDRQEEEEDDVVVAFF